MKVAYLGPAATFTEAALLQLIESGDVWSGGAGAAGAGDTGGSGCGQIERVPVISANAALDGIASGAYDAAVMPIENSLEGGVPATLDALMRVGHARIVAETVVPVRFVLAARPGTALADVQAFGTHPHAEAQTREWMGAHLPDAQFMPAPSTAAAAKQLGAGEVPFHATVCPELAAQAYGLEVVADDIGTAKNAVTRFILVKPNPQLPTPTGADKTTIVATLATDKAGSLLGLLEQFSARRVNLSRIESRPTGDGLGLYKFSIDISGHVREPRVSEALAGVHRMVRKLQFLGSYPAADGIPVEVDSTSTASSFDDSTAWVRSILG